MDNNKIGAFIATLRKEVGLTQSQLADKLHVTDKAISRWENGIGVPDIEMIKKIAKIFNVTIDEMYSGMRIDNLSIVRKKKIKKRCLSIFSVIFVICFIALFIYFIVNFNSVKFYKLHIESNDFELNNSYFMKAKNSGILNVGEIVSYKDIDMSKLYIEIYEKDSKEVLYTGLYKPVYLEGVSSLDVDKLYLKLIYSEEDFCSELKINSSLRFANDRLFYGKKDKVEEFAADGVSEIVELLNELGFDKKEDDIYYKEDDNSTTYVNISSNVFNKVITNKSAKEIISYYKGSNSVDYQFMNLNSKTATVSEEFYYMIDSNSYTCVTGRCNNYDEVMRRLEMDLKIIKLLRK